MEGIKECRLEFSAYDLRMVGRIAELGKIRSEFVEIVKLTFYICSGTADFICDIRETGLVYLSGSCRD